MKILFFGLFIVCLVSCYDKSNDNAGDLEYKAYKSYIDGNYSRSIVYYDKLIRIDSLNGQHYYGRASAYGSMGKVNGAINDYFKSIQLDYRKAACYFGIGLLNTYVHDSLAAFYFTKSLETYSESSDSEALLKRENIQKEYDECLERIKRMKLVGN